MKRVIYCTESWHVRWDWLPWDWSTFGWHTMQLDGVIYKALNLGPLSIHNDWVPVKKESE